MDEITQRTIGMENNRFLSGRVGFNKVEEHKFFGPVWESMSYLAEQAVFTEPLRVKLLLRRALLWSFFVFGLWRLYLMGLRNNGWGMVGLGKVERQVRLSSMVDFGLLNGTQQSQLRWGAMLPVLMVALWPRMFAEAHYNTKDALFFVMVLLVVDGLDRVWSREKKRWDWGWMGVMGLLGVATTIRMGGLFILGLAMVWPALQNLNKRKAAEKSMTAENTYSGFTLLRKNNWIYLIWGCVAFVVGYIGSYPYLWFTGFDGLKQVLGFVFENPWPHGALFFGSMEPSRWYLLGWMITTLSGLILVPLLLGGCLLLAELLLGKRNFAFNTVNFLLLLLLLYLGFVMVKKPVMYDAWRHSLFLLLPVVIISTRCWVSIHHKLKLHIKWQELWVFVTAFTLVGSVMGVFCPDSFAFLSKQNDQAQNKTELYLESGQTYFNGLGQKLIKRYPMQIDYWHQTNYQALKWIVRQLPADASATVIGRGESLMLNWMLLPSSVQTRLHCVTSEFLDTTLVSAPVNISWPLVNAKFENNLMSSPSKLVMSELRIPPTKQVFWIDFGDHLQLGANTEYPITNGVVSWELVQSFYRESLPLLRVYKGRFSDQTKDIFSGK